MTKEISSGNFGSQPYQSTSNPSISSSPPTLLYHKAISWSAVIAGALAAAVLSLVLLVLGVGLGFSAVSPWANAGASATALGLSAILWLSFMQFLSSGLGGYIAGRLRHKWENVHSDDAYFRDTVHGFLTWAIATLVTASLLASTVGTILNYGTQAGAKMIGGAATAVVTAGIENREKAHHDATSPLNYFVDNLFRKEPSINSSFNNLPSAREENSMGAHEEVARILMQHVQKDQLPEEDLRYLSQIVAQRTGISPQLAEKRVVEIYNRWQTSIKEAKTAADKARKVSASTALWFVVSFLIGAFIASYAATCGSRQREKYTV
jgi:hypothetical protein